MGQCPSLLAGAVIRNAAFDVVAKVGISDIPEWNFVEALGKKDFLWEENLCLKPEEVEKMWDVSPIKVSHGHITLISFRNKLAFIW